MYNTSYEGRLMGMAFISLTDRSWPYSAGRTGALAGANRAPPLRSGCAKNRHSWESSLATASFNVAAVAFYL